VCDAAAALQCRPLVEAGWTLSERITDCTICLSDKLLCVLIIVSQEDSRNRSKEATIRKFLRIVHLQHVSVMRFVISSTIVSGHYLPTRHGYESLGRRSLTCGKLSDHAWHLIVVSLNRRTVSNAFSISCSMDCKLHAYLQGDGSPNANILEYRRMP